MKNILNRAFNRIKNRFSNVWTEKYPKYWHLISLVGGIIVAIAFVAMPETREKYSSWTVVGLFFAVVAIGYLTIFIFTYGIVRSRNAWTKKRK